ncbi:MAG: endonuclease/exonuclease/phosphatase family protein [Sphingomonadales bacterium]|nr:endonuclease/exonuclease/phosphatase family protein [Sphingomonadales bacterium]
MTVNPNIHNDIIADPEWNFVSRIVNSNDSDTDFFTDSPYSNIEFNCSYVSESQFTIQTVTVNKFNVLSLNIQSLQAKFESLKLFINYLSSSKREPEIICLQEIWRIESNSEFNLPGYQPLIFKTRTNLVQGGGVGIFIKNGIKHQMCPNYSIFQDRIFESLFIEVEVSKNKKIVIGSCYRPNTHPTFTGTQQLSSFNEIFSNLISTLPADSFILGDFNINLLNIQNRTVIDFIDTLFSFGFLQNILYPTRIAQNSATLIDHVICNSNSLIRNSFIIINDISDHYPVLYSLNFDLPKPKHKLTPSRNFAPDRLAAFGNSLRNMNWFTLNLCF